MSFEGKVILVTGAGSGMGADVARHLAKLGGKIVLVDLSESNLYAVANQIRKDRSSEALVLVSDVKEAQYIIDATISHFKKLDVLINCAGFGVKESIMDCSLDVFDKIFSVNLRSIFALTKSAVPHLEKTKGNIVNVSSMAGLVPVSYTPYYSMSKAALDQFTQCAAVEFGPKGIRVNSINPGATKTPIWDRLGLSFEAKMKMFEGMGKRNPLGRMCEVSDTTAAITYLASERAAFINGVLLRVDGGALSALAS